MDPTAKPAHPHLEKIAGRFVRIGHEVAGVGKDIREIEELERRRIHRYGRMLGPGVIAGAADDDAGGIATYSIVGATTGFALSWLLLASTPMLIAVQEMCARVGNVARRGLASAIKEKFGFPAALFSMALLAAANVATISADIAGMAVALELLSGGAVPWLWSVVPATLLAGYAIIYKNFSAIQKGLLGLSLFLVAYIAAGIISGPDWNLVLQQTLVPRISLDSGFLIAAVGLLGTTITPYLFFWQARTEIEAHRTEHQLKKMKFDIFAGMIYSNVVSYFIIISAATALFQYYDAGAGTFTINGETIAAGQLSVREIALALKPVAGDYTFYLFAIGLLGASALATIVLATSTAYAVCDTFGWPSGLNKRVWQARQFYATTALALGAGAIALFAGLNPIQAMFWSQVLCGIAVPFILYFLLRIVNDAGIMGVHTNNLTENAVGWGTFAIISGFVLMMFYSLIFPA
ncbi:MAG: Nramp family divalent metal transporter [Candidatus Micrarchaeia archaeon]|jgi:NRAMP (natural resistance-associated macrophage protein)-like metal ion transporter